MQHALAAKKEHLKFHIKVVVPFLYNFGYVFIYQDW